MDLNLVIANDKVLNVSFSERKSSLQLWFVFRIVILLRDKNWKTQIRSCTLSLFLIISKYPYWSIMLSINTNLPNFLDEKHLQTITFPLPKSTVASIYFALRPAPGSRHTPALTFEFYKLNLLWSEKITLFQYASGLLIQSAHNKFFAYV